MGRCMRSRTRAAAMITCPDSLKQSSQGRRSRMLTPAERLKVAMRAPVVAAMFACANTEGLAAEDLADPAVALAVASAAMTELAPWSGHAAGRRYNAMLEAERMRPFVASIVNDARNHWWWADIEREHQIWISDVCSEFADFEYVGRSEREWLDAYAQHPDPQACIDSSTEMCVSDDDNIRSGLHNELSRSVPTDWEPEYPLRQFRAIVRPEARVFEIHCPEAWHNLSVTYAMQVPSQRMNAQLLSSAGMEAGPAPNWQRVARDWDGIHLSFFGLITSLFVTENRGGVSTTLWAWPSERTLWLRSAFSDVVVLSALDEAPSPMWQPMSVLAGRSHAT